MYFPTDFRLIQHIKKVLLSFDVIIMVPSTDGTGVFRTQTNIYDGAF